MFAPHVLARPLRERLDVSRMLQRPAELVREIPCIAGAEGRRGAAECDRVLLEIAADHRNAPCSRLEQHHRHRLERGREDEEPRALQVHAKLVGRVHVLAKLDTRVGTRAKRRSTARIRGSIADHEQADVVRDEAECVEEQAAPLRRDDSPGGEDDHVIRHRPTVIVRRIDAVRDVSHRPVVLRLIRRGVPVRDAGDRVREPCERPLHHPDQCLGDPVPLASLVGRAVRRGDHLRAKPQQWDDEARLDVMNVDDVLTPPEECAQRSEEEQRCRTQMLAR